MDVFTVVNPATEEPLAELALAGAADVDDRVAAALRAWSRWRATAPETRAASLFALAGLVHRHAEELALLETRNVGKPISEARAEVAMCVDVLRYYAGAVDKHLGQTIPVRGGVDLVLREPLGVVGVIVPWNFPLAIACWQVAPALATGNTVVLKPSELTPLTALELARLALRAGFPEGVLGVVVGTGAEAGRRLVEHPDVAKIAFTGSTAVGRGVMAGAAGTVKRVTLELGGKAANIIFADADLDRATADAVSAVFGNAGQDCCSRARILVQRPVYEEFVERFVAHVRDLAVGDPESPGTRMGPLVSAAHRDRVTSFLADAPAEPAFLGQVPQHPGFWFPPTVYRDVDRRARIAREEIFGPVAAVSAFADEAEAVAIANDTPYGLAGSVWTTDLGRALRVAGAVRAGNISVNSNTAVRVAAPFGGFKQSGVGRGLGMHAMDSYTEVKNVYLDTGADR